MPDGLLRGVPACDMLGNFGSHWEGLAGGQHELSEPVDMLDDFISHDWDTGRWRKFFTLCVVYNGRPASCISICAGAFLCVLQTLFPAIRLGLFKSTMTTNEHSKTGASERTYTFDTPFWSIFVCPMVFAVVFLFWQRILKLFGSKRRMCFVDKHCINQTDPVLKHAGVYALAGFLAHSDRLVLLWSPRYFKRLWCSFELATWLHLGNDLSKSVVFVPVNLVLTSFAVFMCTQVLTATLHFGIGIGLPLPVFYVFALFTYACWVHAVRRSCRDMRLLPKQLASFDVRETQCYCCTNKHIDPMTGKPMTCDRQVVYGTLKKWFGSKACADDDDDHLRIFNGLVRTIFAREVMHKTGRAGASYTSVLFMLTPQVWKICDWLPIYSDVGEADYALSGIIELFLFTFATVPITISLTMRALVALDGRIGIVTWSRMLDAVVSLFAAILLLIGFVVLWFAISPSFSGGGYFVQAVGSVGEILLAISLFRRKAPKIEDITVGSKTLNDLQKVLDEDASVPSPKWQDGFSSQPLTGLEPPEQTHPPNVSEDKEPTDVCLPVIPNAVFQVST